MAEEPRDGNHTSDIQHPGSRENTQVEETSGAMQLLAIDVYNLIHELMEPHDPDGLCLKKLMEVEKLFENSAIRKFPSSADQQLWTQLWVDRCMCAKRKGDELAAGGDFPGGLTCEEWIAFHVGREEWIAFHVGRKVTPIQLLWDILDFEKATLQKWKENGVPSRIGEPIVCRDSEPMSCEKRVSGEQDAVPRSCWTMYSGMLL